MSFTGSLSLISLFDDINGFSRRSRHTSDVNIQYVYLYEVQNFHDIKFRKYSA